MRHRIIKPLCWLITFISLIYSFSVEGLIDSSFYRSISIVFFIVSLTLNNKNIEIPLSINHKIKPVRMQTKTLTLNIETILHDNQNEMIVVRRKNYQQRGI